MEQKKPKPLIYHIPRDPYKKMETFFSHYQKNTSDESFYKPLGVEIEMSHHCNIVCGGCGIKQDIINDKYRLTETEILDFLHQGKTNGLIGYSLTGGEPFTEFQKVKSIIQKAPIDLIKINTNGSFFSSPKNTRKLLQELKDAGFGSKNKEIKSWLNISVGQQTAAGIPLEFGVFAARDFYKYFDQNNTGISINVFSINDNYSNIVADLFVKKYQELAGHTFNERLVPIIMIGAIRQCSSAFGAKIQFKETKTLKELVDEYLIDFVRNCSPIEDLKEKNVIAPRMMLRADGLVYSCFGFAHSHLLGNIRTHTLKDMIESANKNIVLKTMFTKGLKGLLALAEKKQKGIGNTKLSLSFGPCDICKIMVNVVKD